MTTVALPWIDDPDVSVVIARGVTSLDERTVADLAESTDASFELILVADEELAPQVEGATIVRGETGASLAAAHNQGARLARGRALCFLDGETLVEPGWLPPLLETVADPEVGAVTPLVLNPGGTVREAGGIVDSIGARLPIAAGSDPRARELGFRREVDFGSAACLMVRAEAFHELGGFDERLSPLEDADLCFRLRERHLRTVYEPRARVTSRSAPSRGRSAIFVERWSEFLAQRPRVIDAERKPHRLLAARDAEALERFLVVVDGRGEPRLSAIIGELATLWPWARITLAGGNEREVEPLLRQGIEVVEPAVDWEDWFAERRFHYGVVLAYGLGGAEHFAGHLGASQPQALRIYDAAGLAFRQLERHAELLPPGNEQRATRAKAARAREAEVRAIQEAAVVFAASEREASFAAEVAPRTPCFILPGIAEGVDTAPGFDERSDLLFVSAPGLESGDALAYLVHEVLPSFWEGHPDVGLNVIGSADRGLEDPRVRIVGEVEDPAGWLSRARLHVWPLRYRAGPGPLLGPLGAGLPFVTTTAGAEGLALGDVRESLVGDDPARLASLMSRLYDDRAEWERVQARLLELAVTRFDRSSFQRTLLEAMSHVGVAPSLRFRREAMGSAGFTS